MKRLLLLLCMTGSLHAVTSVCRTDKCRQRCSPNVRITHEPVRCTQERTIIEKPCKRRVIVEDKQPYEVCKTTYVKTTVTERCLAPCGQKNAIPKPEKCISLSRRKEARYMRKGMISVDGRGCGHCYRCGTKKRRCEQDACNRATAACQPCLNPRKACRRYEEEAPVRTIRSMPATKTEGVPATTAKPKVKTVTTQSNQATKSQGYAEEVNSGHPTNYLDDLEKELVSRLR